MALLSLKTGKESEVFRNPETIEHEANDSETENDSDNESNGSGAEGNAGWANSLAKVLNTTKPKTKKALALSRAKKIKTNDQVTKKKVDYGFEIEGENIKDEKPDKLQLDENINAKKNIHLDLRVKPTWKDMEREKALRKIAQKGVVQLFNAVRIQQKDIQQQLEEAGPLDSRKDAVLNNINKRKFLDVLMGGKRAKSEAVDNAIKDEIKSESSEDDRDESKKSEWSVLRDDFMTNKKSKHWDQEDDSDNPQDDDHDDSDESDD